MRQLLTALAALVGFGHAPASDNPVAAAEEYLSKRFPADKPGGAVLIARKGEPLLVKGYGLANVDRKAPITPDSAFDLASVSKPFTALAVMILAERGKLTYDDELGKWIPDWPAFDGHRPLRVRDLLNQTSGLPDYLSLYKGGDATFARLTNADLPALFRGRKLEFTPGARFDYSNSNYALLALVVQRVSGQGFGQFMEENVFAPSGMSASRVMDRLDVDIPNRVTGYRRAFWTGKFTPSRKDGPVCGDGNLFTTVRDLAKWDAALVQNKLVRPESLELAFTIPNVDGDKPSDYGFGWVVKVKDGKKLVWHNGGWAGTRTALYRVLADGLTVAVLCNEEAENPERVATEVMKRYRGAVKSATDAPTSP